MQTSQTFPLSCAYCKMLARMRARVAKQQARPTVPFSYLQIDTFSPGDAAADRHGYKYCLTAVDEASRYCFAVPIKNETSTEVIRTLRESIFPVTGYPTVMKMDQARYFVSWDLAEYLWDRNIRVQFGVSDRHTNQPMVESMHNVLRDYFRRIVQPQHNDAQGGLTAAKKGDKRKAKAASFIHSWSELLPECIQAMRNAKHSATGMSPNFYLFGGNTRDATALLTDRPNKETQMRTTARQVRSSRLRLWYKTHSCRTSERTATTQR